MKSKKRTAIGVDLIATNQILLNLIVMSEDESDKWLVKQDLPPFTSINTVSLENRSFCFFKGKHIIDGEKGPCRGAETFQRERKC